MSVERSPRESEVAFKIAFENMMHLNNVVWANMKQDAKERVEFIKKQLDKVLILMEAGE